jgi:hypothetical protein
VTSPASHRSASSPPAQRRIWTSRRALICHVVLLIWIPGCALATWWQIDIARSGDGLGWVYSVMWPCFALFATVLWWNLIHDDPDTVGARGVRRLQREAEAEAAAAAVATVATDADGPAPPDAITRAEAEDAELAAYNAYLAELRRTPDSKTWRRH